MKKILIPIILTVLVAVSSCGPKRYLTTSRAPGVSLDTINYGAYNNDPSADKARTAFTKANGPIREYNRLQLYNLEPTEIAILRGATVTTAELNRVAGVTSAIQTQINGRVRAVDSTGNAAGNYVTRKALRDSIAVRDTLIALKANSDSPTFTTTATLPETMTIGDVTVTGVETLTTGDITELVLFTVGDTTVTAAVGKVVFKISDTHLYLCRQTTGKKWYQILLLGD